MAMSKSDIKVNLSKTNEMDSRLMDLESRILSNSTDIEKLRNSKTD
jgi:hypothetical protein